MTAYILRRLVQLPITVFGVTVLIFLMLQILSPAERAALYIKDIPKNEAQIDRVIKRYGLDKPMPRQSWRFGASFRSWALVFGWGSSLPSITIN